MNRTSHTFTGQQTSVRGFFARNKSIQKKPHAPFVLKK